MDILGTVERKPIKKDGKWDYVHIEYENQEEFNNATAKIMEILYKKNAEGKCYVKDIKGNKYDLDIIHATFNIEENRISVYPYNCHAITIPTTNKTSESNNKINKKAQK